MPLDFPLEIIVRSNVILSLSQDDKHPCCTVNTENLNYSYQTYWVANRNIIGPKRGLYLNFKYQKDGKSGIKLIELNYFEDMSNLTFDDGSIVELYHTNLSLPKKRVFKYKATLDKDYKQRLQEAYPVLHPEPILFSV